MKRLSLLDALFLYMESPETPMHVASVTIFKPTAPRDDLFAQFREHIAGRLDLLPSSRRRLAPTPLGIDHPVWVTENNLDLDYHVRHQALPKPGGMEELRNLIGRLHAVPLDRSRPLWEYHFIEGLEGGAFAVYVKVHHSTMDGLAGMATLGVTYDFAPGAEHEIARERIVPPDDGPSDAIELTSTAVGDFVRQGWRAVKSLPGVVRALRKIAPNFSRDVRFLYNYAKDMPRTPFNVAISGHRVYATSSLSLPEVKALAKSRGVTINDAVMALCAGALRRYLTERDAQPEKALTAGVPVSIRPIGDMKLNNQVFFTLSRLPTDVAEPLERLAAAKAAGQEAKNLFSDMRELATTDVSILGAPLVLTGLTRLWAGAKAANYSRPFFNVAVSNVPGPRQPMYCVGAQATHYFPVSIPYHGCALNITVQSYLDQLDFGLTACAEAVPHVQSIADYIADEFEAMRKADAESRQPGWVEAIAAEHKPMTLDALKAERQPLRNGRKGELTQRIDELSEATEALARGLERAQHPAPAKTRPVKPKAPPCGKAAASKPSASNRVQLDEAPVRSKRTRPAHATRLTSGRRRRKRPTPVRSKR